MDSVVLVDEPSHLRAFIACDSCKTAKRKCDGAPISTGSIPCSWCTSRGTPCEYTPHKKRGPVALKRRLPSGNFPGWRPASTGIVHASLMSPGRALCRARVLPGPDPSVLDPDLRRGLCFANRIMKVVDEPFLFGALDCEVPVSQAASLNGLRACVFMLISLGHKLRGDDEGAAKEFAFALDAIGQAMDEPPNPHIVSSLLIACLLTGYLGRDPADAAPFASLADALVRFVPGICSDICLSVACLKSESASLGPAGSKPVVWPASVAQIGESPLVRMYSLFGFVITQFMLGHASVSEPHMPTFFGLLDEAVALQSTQGMPASSLDLAAISPATKALLCLRHGRVNDAVMYATIAFSRPVVSFRILGGMSMMILSRLLLAIPDMLAVASSADESRSRLQAVCPTLLRGLCTTLMPHLCDPSSAFAEGSFSLHFVDSLGAVRQHLGNPCTRPVVDALIDELPCLERPSIYAGGAVTPPPSYSDDGFSETSIAEIVSVPGCFLLSEREHAILLVMLSGGSSAHNMPV